VLNANPVRAVRRLLREPLVHFLGLGLGLFLLFWLVGDSSEAPANRIVVSRERIAQLAEVYARTWQRPPTKRELDGLIEDHIREEIYYREALAMGLDENDTVVRRRLRQKLEFVADDLVDAVEPTVEQLESFLDENADRFREPARLSFRHVYLDPEHRGEQIDEDVGALLAALNGRAAETDSLMLGDPLMLESNYRQVTSEQVARDFGRGFADAVSDLPVGCWSGPIVSGYGVHIVRVDKRWPGSLPPLGEIRAEVEREWRAERGREAKTAFYEALRARYEISVERPDASDADGSPDVAEARE
jgi:hypothetical protein